MSVGQLAESAGLSVDEVVGLVLNTSRKSAPRSKRAAGTSQVSSQSKAVAGSFSATPHTYSTRTQAGRDALDAAITATLKKTGQPMRAVDLRVAVGGTAPQMRARLNSLIEAGTVVYTGRSSGTRYELK